MDNCYLNFIVCASEKIFKMEDLIRTKSLKNALFVGEGNFSFSTALTELWQDDNARVNSGTDYNTELFNLSNVYSTCYENQPVSELAKKNIEILKQRRVQVYLGVDAATNFEENTMKDKLKCDLFDKVVFMFPHVGGKMKIKKNRDLLRNFAMNIVNYLNPTNKNSQVIITLCGGQGGTPFDPVQRCEPDTWQVLKMFSYGGLQLVSVSMFDFQEYFKTMNETYASYGYRGGNKGFHVEKSVVHVFELAKPPLHLQLLIKAEKKLVCGQHTPSLEDVKAEYIQRKVNQILDNNTLIGKTLEIIVHFIKQVCKEKIDVLWEPLDSLNIIENLEKDIRKIKLVDDEKQVDKIIELEIVLEKQFTLDFSVCPVRPYILIKNCFDELKNKLVKKFSSGLRNLNGDSTLLFDLTKLSCDHIDQECHEYFEAPTNGEIPWQYLWSAKKSLYPPKYSHCLSFWLPKNEYSTCQQKTLDQTSLAIILWSCGYETVISCEMIDIYEEEGRISNTMKLEYQSYNFALSPTLAFDIQTESIAKTLNRLLTVDIR